jgi:hypothetical protein
MNKRIFSTVLKAIAVAMGVVVIVLNTLGSLNTGVAFTLLAIGLTSLAVDALQKDEEKS